MPAQPPELQPERPPPAGADARLDALREILLTGDRKRLGELAERLRDLEHRTGDDEALVAMIAPVLGDLIRRNVRDAREEMIEALYPIIGQVVLRAVSEAIRDLARGIDAQLRSSLGLAGMARRARARLSGVPRAELLLRDALPYAVAEIFWIHRSSGLLLWHHSDQPAETADGDLIGAMLTAIRDFAQDAFGHGERGQLDEIQFGERRILIEPAQHSYLAVVVSGIEPAGFRAGMRERLIALEHTQLARLRDYDGDPVALAGPAAALRQLAAAPAAPAPALRPAQRGALALLLLGLLAACMAGVALLRPAAPEPRPAPLVVVLAAPSAVPTAAPTATLAPTQTPAPTATAAPSATPVRVGVMIGNVFVHTGAGDDTPRLGPVVERGQQVELLDTTSGWYAVRWRDAGGAEVVGWVPAEWVRLGTP